MFRWLHVLFLGCALAACTSSATQDSSVAPDGGLPGRDATASTDTGIVVVDDGGVADDATTASQLERPPGVLPRPPTRLPEELKPPR